MSAVEEKNAKRGREVFSRLCDVLDEEKWKYDRDEENLTVKFNLVGEDLPMDFLIVVDSQRQLLRILSRMSFAMAKERRLKGAIAINNINMKLADGNFDYDYRSGRIAFRTTTSFRESLISKQLIGFMVEYSGFLVDKYNDKLLMISKGLMEPDKLAEDEE